MLRAAGSVISRFCIQSAATLMLISSLKAAPAFRLDHVTRLVADGYTFVKVVPIGHYLIAGTSGQGWMVMDISNLADVHMVFRYDVPSEILDRKVYGNELFLGSSEGLVRFDLTDPANPASGILYHYKKFPTYSVAVQDGWIYDATDFGLYIYDFNQDFPFRPAIDGMITGVAIESDRLVVRDTSQLFSGLDIYNISHVSPSGPALEFGTHLTFNLAPIGRFQVQNQRLFAANWYQLQTVDISSASSPSPLLKYILPETYQTNAANVGILDLEPRGDFVYLATGSHGVQIIDWRGPRRAGIFQTYGSAQSVAMSGDFIYVSEGLDGIQVLKQTPIEVEPVRILEPLELKTVKTGESTVLSTSATGEPPLSFQWYRGREILQGETNQTLTLANVSKLDQANYRFEVGNAIESVSTIARLRVLGGLQLTALQTNRLMVSFPGYDFSGEDTPFLDLQMSTNLQEWTSVPLITVSPLQTNLVLSIAGKYQGLSRRYFRIWEKP
jgi:hypothetical protein